jgi:hypothetical protein
LCILEKQNRAGFPEAGCGIHKGIEETFQKNNVE